VRVAQHRLGRVKVTPKTLQVMKRLQNGS
jgi:hypothetical protein